MSEKEGSGSAITPGVKKTTRRFAPVKRGGKSPAAKRREAAAAAEGDKASETASAGDSSSAAESSTAGSQTPSASKSTAIGTIRPTSAESGRLPSINDGQKTRGGAIKMKFKPTIPHKRNKKEATASSIDEALNKSKERGGPSARGERSGAYRSRGGRGRGRGRGGRAGPGGIILVDESTTASGIFSLGPSIVSRMNRPVYSGGGGLASYGGDVPSRAEGDSSNSDMVDMFTTNMREDTPVTFRHISRLDGDIDPVSLEQKVEKVPWMIIKREEPTQVKKEDDVNNVPVKAEPTDEMADILQDDTPLNLDDDKSKDTPVTLDDDDTENKAEEKKSSEEPAAATENEIEPPKVYMDSDAPVRNIFALDQHQKLVCVAEDELLHFQLPAVIPRFEKPKEPEVAEVDAMDTEMSETGELKKEDKKDKDLPAAAKKTLLEDAMANLELEDMPDGQVGKLIIYKSGKMKMKFGSILMDVNQGMHPTFLENVMVVDHESDETKKAIELGHVVQKFVCVPNMDTLLEDDGIDNNDDVQIV